MDAAFYIAKELVMTERTYKKDLQVIAVVSKRHFNQSINQSIKNLKTRHM